MELLEAIFTRRSIRKYSGHPLSEEQLETIIKAGCAAPSAHNRQPWHFVVVRKPENLAEIAKQHPYAKMLPEAGCGIVVCGDKRAQGEVGFMIEDCSAAIENMLLAVTGLGLGAVWCGLYPITKLTHMMTSLLDLPGDIVPVGLVVIGNKGEEKEKANRFDPAKIHYEKW